MGLLKKIFSMKLEFDACGTFLGVDFKFSKKRKKGNKKLLQNCLLSVGEFTYGHEEALKYCCCKVTIGSFCSFANNVQIGVSQHPQVITTSHFYDDIKYFECLDNNVEDTELYQSYNKLIEIGNDVWIGTNSVIMPGVKIGNGAIIGAGSIVTKDIPPYAVVYNHGGGTNVQRYRFEAEDIVILEKSQWWNWKKEFLYEYRNLFKDKEKFFKFIKENESLIKENLRNI